MVGGKIVKPLWKILHFLKKLTNTQLLYDSIPEYFTQEKREYILTQDLYMNTHSSFVIPNNGNNPDVHQRWMDFLKNLVYSYSVIPLRNKKKWSTDTRNNVDEPQNKYAEWKKSDKLVCTLRLHFCKTLENANSSIKTEDQMVAWRSGR